MAALRAEYAGRGQESLVAEVTPFVGFEGGYEEHYAAAANRAGITVGATRKAVFDFRKRHYELLREFLGDTIATSITRSPRCFALVMRRARRLSSRLSTPCLFD
jgi:hypothetical protein